MHIVSFDFREIADCDAFYRQFAAKFNIEMAFGHNLDALWDGLTGMIDLPARIMLRHLDTHPCAGQFDKIVSLLHEAEAETHGLFSVRIS